MQYDPKQKFNMTLKPPAPKRFLLPVEWIGSIFMAAPFSAAIKKINCEGLTPPYLMLATHASMRDFPMAIRATFPHRSYWVISVEEFAGREWLLRSAGGIGKRKFTQQLPVVRHIINILKKQKMIVTIYPEARYSLAGINEKIDGALGKLAKQCRVPVVVFMQHGNFLNSPQWCKKPTRPVRSEGEMRQIVTREEVETLSAEEIQKRIEDAFVYDEYAWQRDNHIRIPSRYRAHNIHRILYQCPVCGQEHTMTSEYTQLWCTACGARWRMDEYGVLDRLDGENVFTHVPDWYRWERENVNKEVREGRYHFEDEARLELLVSSFHKFREIGRVHLRHDYDGFTVTGTLDDGTAFSLNRSPQSMMSCHIEYDFKGRGDAIDLATNDDSYWVYPLTAKNPLTKLHFATEALHELAEEKLHHPEEEK